MKLRPSKHHRNTASLILMMMLLAPAWQNCSPFGVTNINSSPGTNDGQSTGAPPVSPPSVPVGQKITSIEVQRLSGTGKPQFITFGHSFRKGDVPAGTRLVAQNTGSPIPIQTDVKTLHDDGSLNFAVITLFVDTSKNAAVDFYASAEPEAASSNLTADWVSGLPDLDVTVQLPTKTIIVRDSLKRAIAQNELKGMNNWLQGPLVSEFRFKESIDPHLFATIETRAYSTGAVRVSVMMENSYIDQPGMGKKTYTVDIKKGTTSLFSRSITHVPFTNWRKTFLVGDTWPETFIKRDREYLLNSGAVPHYDASVMLSREKINTFNGTYDLFDCGSGPGCGNVTKAMGTTGGRGDIGVLPEWSVIYLLSMDPVAEKNMLTSANVSGAIPWHVKESTTGEPITSLKYRGLWLDGRDRSNSFPNSFADLTSNQDWQIDDSHQPSLTYLPYLITGEQYYLDELLGQVTFNALLSNPDYTDENPNNYTGYRIWSGQVRGTSWSFRTHGQAVAATPIGHPMKAYLSEWLDRNFNYYIKNYVQAYSGGPQRVIVGDYRDGFAPWQDDFFSMTMGHLAFMGFAKAATILDWKSGFTAGRFTTTDFCNFEGAAYYLKPGFAERSYKTWAEAKAGVFPSGCPSNSFPDNDYPGSYNGGAWAAVNSLVSVSPTAENLKARDFLQKNLKILNRFDEDPTFAIVPWAQ